MRFQPAQTGDFSTDVDRQDGHSRDDFSEEPRQRRHHRPATATLLDNALFPPVRIELVSLVQYLFVATVLPLLVIVPGSLVLTAVGVRDLKGIILGPGITVLFVGALAALALLIAVPFRIVSWVIIALLVAITAAAAFVAHGRDGPAALRLSPEARPAIAIFVAVYALLVGFNGIPSNPPGSIDPCAPPTPGKLSYIPSVHPGPCDVFAPPSLTMPRLPNRSIDDLLQFRTAQAIWNRKLFGERDFAGGWRLQDRTPLLGLVTAGLGSLGNVDIPVGYPPQVYFPKVFGPPGPMWLQRVGAPSDSSITPQSDPDAFVPAGTLPAFLDRWGYWLFRLVAIVMSCLMVLPTYWLGTRLFNARIGVLAAIAAGVSPAIMQNAYYTSPKYLAVYFGLVALLLVIHRRPAFAGLAIGAAYLCHPLGVIIGAGIGLYQLMRSRKAAVATMLCTAALAAPWVGFTKATNHTSSLATDPLGCVGPTVTLDSCWRDFKARPASSILWQRAVIVPELVVPLGLTDSPLQPPSKLGLVLKWLTFHDFAYIGMVGFVFFPFVILGIARGWNQHRRLFGAMVLAQIAVITVIWGIPYRAAWVAGLGVLPFIYVFGAVGLASASRRVARWGLGIAFAEWVLYLAALFFPIDGVSTGQYVAGLSLILGSLLFLLRRAFVAIDPDRSDTSKMAAAPTHAVGTVVATPGST